MSKNSTILRSVTLGVSLAVGAVSGAGAQETPVHEASTSDEIVVTAQKREERLRDVPIAISVIDGELLDSRRVDGVEDLTSLVPGLEVGEANGGYQGNISLRGMAPQNFGTATVVTFVDGYTTGLRTDATAALFDIERVEVLKGPQATLYGRNAIGGAINYVTREPSDTVEGRAQISYGSYGAYLARGSISGPIIEGVLDGRLSMASSGRDGFLDNALTGQRGVDDRSDQATRLDLRLTPTPQFQSRLQLSFATTDNACGDCSLGFRDFDPLNPTAVSTGGVDFNELTDDLNQDVLGGFKRRIASAVWTNEYDFGGVSLTSITGYTDQDIDLGIDFNFDPGAYFGFYVSSQSANGDTTFSQELRLASTEPGRFQWLIGAYYFDQDDSFDATAALTFGPDALLVQTRSSLTNYAVFANASYELLPSLTIAAGLRYDDEILEADDLILATTTRTEAEEILPRFSAVWELSDQTNLYGSVSRGYRSGGVNAGVPGFGLPPQTTYDPEFVWNYEIGLKGSAGRLQYDVAGFYVDWQDQQVTSSTGLLTYIVNAGRSEIRGLEAALQFDVSDNLRLSAAGAWMNAEYKDFLDLSGAPVYFGAPAQRAGGRLPLAADFSAVFSADYETSLSANWEFLARANVRYIGERGLDSSALTVADPVTVADLTMGLRNGNFGVSIFGTNITDERYPVFARMFATFRPLVQTGDPAQFGVQLDYSF